MSLTADTHCRVSYVADRLHKKIVFLMSLTADTNCRVSYVADRLHKLSCFLCRWPLAQTVVFLMSLTAFTNCRVSYVADRRHKLLCFLCRWPLAQTVVFLMSLTACWKWNNSNFAFLLLMWTVTGQSSVLEVSLLQWPAHGFRKNRTRQCR